MLVTLLAVAATAVSATSYNFHKGPKTEVFDVNLDGQADGPQPGAKPIYYQSYGARVIDQPANINLIWYGNWTQSQRGIINDFLDNLGYNDWYAVNQRYYQAASVNATRSYIKEGLTVQQQITDNYSRGKLLSGDNDVSNVVIDHLNNGDLSIDRNALNVVLTADDVIVPGFCKYFCGYHSYLTSNVGNVYFAFIGNAASQCVRGCTPYAGKKAVSSVSPNGDLGVDGLLSVLAHEVVEWASDPDLDAWGDDDGNENADKCAWTFGDYQKTENGAGYNVEWSGRKFLIQRNWDPIFQGCYGKVQPACTPATNGSYCDVNNPCCLKFGCNC